VKPPDTLLYLSILKETDSLFILNTKSLKANELKTL
jgi:hypothetical protein